MNKSYNPQTPKIVGGVVISAFVAIAVYTFIIQKPETDTAINTSSISKNSNVSTASETQRQSDTTSSSNSTNQSTGGTSTSTSYKDGTYTASADYRVPHGTNSIKATLTIKNGTVQSLEVADDFTDRESSVYVSSFESRVKSVVEGKALGSISVGRIGGASLTSQAFENVLSDIIVDARI